MASKWMAAATQKDNMQEGGKGSFRHIGKKGMQDHGEPDADDQPVDKKKKKGGIVAQMNEPEMY